MKFTQVCLFIILSCITASLQASAAAGAGAGRIGESKPTLIEELHAGTRSIESLTEKEKNELRCCYPEPNNPALLWALITKKDEVLANKLLSIKVNPNLGCIFQGDASLTPLIAASRNGFLSTVQLLTQAPGINLEIEDPNGFTALTHALIKGQILCARELVKAGANVKKPIQLPGNPAITVLAMATQMFDPELIRMTIAAGGEVTNDVVQRAMSAHLHHINNHLDAEQVSKKNAKIIALLTQAAAKKGAQITVPLHAQLHARIRTFASLNPSEKKTLIESNNDKTRPYSLLFWAVTIDDKELAEGLLDLGADPNQGDGEATPLIEASARGNLPMVQLLLAQPRINKEAKNQKGYTAIVHTVALKRKACFCALSDAGANPNVLITRNIGQKPITILQEILQRFDPEWTEMALKAGVNVTDAIVKEMNSYYENGSLHPSFKDKLNHLSSQQIAHNHAKIMAMLVQSKEIAAKKEAARRFEFERAKNDRRQANNLRLMQAKQRDEAASKAEEERLAAALKNSREQDAKREQEAQAKRDAQNKAERETERMQQAANKTARRKRKDEAFQALAHAALVAKPAEREKTKAKTAAKPAPAKQMLAPKKPALHKKAYEPQLTAAQKQMLAKRRMREENEALQKQLQAARAAKALPAQAHEAPQDKKEQHNMPPLRLDGAAPAAHAAGQYAVAPQVLVDSGLTHKMVNTQSFLSHLHGEWLEHQDFLTHPDTNTAIAQYYPAYDKHQKDNTDT